MIATMDVADLLASAARGDQGAWNALVQRYMPLVYSVTRKLNLTQPEAEDVSQTVWLKLIEHLDSIKTPAALPGWIATTTRNAAISALRSGRRTQPVDPAPGGMLDRTSTSHNVENDVMRFEQFQALRSAIDQLRPDYRQLILLMLDDPPHSYEEIGELMGIPATSVGPTRARCLKKLRSSSQFASLLEGPLIPVQRKESAL